jgi:hypothetical protein
VVAVIVVVPALSALTTARSPPVTPYPVTVTDATLELEFVNVEQHDVHLLPLGSLSSM